MGPVSGQLWKWMREALETLPAPGPGRSERLEPIATGEQTSWDDFVSCLTQLEAALGGPAELTRAARDFAGAKLEAARRDDIGFGDTRQALWIGTRTLGPALLPGLVFDFAPKGPETSEVRVTIPTALAACPALFALIEGLLAAAPRALGHPFARVQRSGGARGALFEIELQGRRPVDEDESRLESLATHSESVFLEADSQGVILFVSPNCREVFGRAPEEMVGLRYTEVAEPEQMELAREMELLAQGTDEPQRTEFRFRRPDGATGRCATTAHAFRTRSGERRMIVILQDVTEQVWTQEALVESQERYRRVSELASDYSFCTAVDPRDGSFEREWVTEAAFTRMTGYAPEDCLPQNWEEFIHPDDHPLCRDRFARGLTRGHGIDEFRIITREGETRWIQEHFEVVHCPDGKLRWYGACRDVSEQRLAEEARQVGEQRYRAIAENSWDVIGEFDASGLPTYLSPNVKEVLGWEAEELIAQDNIGLLHPDDLPRVGEHVGKIFRGGDESRLEIRVRHRSEGWRHIELTATPFRTQDGEQRGVFIARDVTERLRNEQALARLGSVVSASSELITVFEPEGRMLFLNRAGRRLAEIGAQGLGSHSLFDLLEPFDATRLREQALGVALDEGSWEGEFRMHPVGGGESFPVLANLFVLPEPRLGEGRTLALVARDIRARKRAENALHESEQRFRMLVENAFDLIAEFDEEGQFVYASPRYRELLGYEPDDLIGQPVLDLLHEVDRPRVEALVDSFIEQPTTDLGPLRVRGRDGTWHWLENQVRHYRRQGGETILVVVSRDITGRRRTEEALKQSQEQLLQSQKMEAIGRLAGGVAHDFNNLLTAITGYGDLLLQELGEGDPLRDDAEEILRAAEQASSLTRQLLAFSRRQVLQPRVVELNALVSDVDRLLRRLIGEHVELVTSLAPDVGAVRVDPVQIEQLLVNLAVNARDAMPRGGRLELLTARLELADVHPAHPGVPAGSWVTLCVSDTGMGIDDQTLGRIFEPFFTTKETGKGTGLGLATVYGVVQQSGGQIRVESDVDGGTTFTVYLPRCGSAPDPVKPHPVLADLRGSETVVLVEGEETVRRLLRRYLEEHGYRVIDAATPVDALRAVRRHEGPVDVLVTDAVLPKMDGRALAGRLQTDHPGLAVLFISGFTDIELSERGFSRGEDALIQKPFSPPELLRALREILSGEPA